MTEVLVLPATRSPAAVVGEPLSRSVSPTALSSTSSIYDVADASLTARTDLCYQLAMASALSHAGDGESFFVTDLGDLQRKRDLWVAKLPSVEPFYAVKCNPDPVIVETLASLGVNFDCASKAEMELVLSYGVDPDRIIFAHPCKSIQHLRYAKAAGVAKMTFDNAFELEKIAATYPEAELVLRILVDDSKARCRLGLKFGADVATCASLFKQAAALGLNIIGISFHVGSGASEASAYGDAVARARSVFDIAKEHGFDFTFLDVGGGFPGHQPTSAASEEGDSDFEDDAADATATTVTFKDIASSINASLAANFPKTLFPNLRVIGEPGRYFVSSACSLAVCVVSKRRIAPEASNEEDTTSSADPTFMFYINDGVYGSFNCIIFDHAHPEPEILLRNPALSDSSAECVDDSATYTSSIWGPTCDSIDCVAHATPLPELNLGDWLVFHNMGAYTSCAASTFNGFRLAARYYTCSTSS